MSDKAIKAAAWAIFNSEVYQGYNKATMEMEWLRNERICRAKAKAAIAAYHAAQPSDAAMTFLEEAREAIAAQDGPENLYTDEMVDRLIFAAEKDFNGLKDQIKWLERNSVLKNPSQTSIYDAKRAQINSIGEI